MTSMMISRITKLLHSLRSILEKKQRTNSIIKIRVFGKDFNRQRCLIKCRKEQFRTIELRRISRFTVLEETIWNSPNFIRTFLGKFLGHNRLLCFIIIHEFSHFRNSLTTVASLPQFTLYQIYLFCVVKTKELIFYSHKNLKLWMFSMILSLEQYITINSNLNPLTKFRISSRSTQLGYILPYNISDMISISSRLIRSCAIIPSLLW